MKIKLGYNFEWMKVYFSPFKFFLPKFYLGKTKIGVPYFLPRNMKLNKETRYYEFSEKKIGFSFCGMGFKTKWSSTDFRHEYNPVWSFVAFGYQIALIFRPEHDIHYFECWLAYEYDTDKSKSRKERLKEAIEKHPCTWTSHYNGEKTTTDYWKVCIKNKYIYDKRQF
jgi:hypothetical protein